ncbi:low molecular weight protein-tyrosine-phosphatase [Ectothiorhodospira shaposhnikovii]|uniref:low molecular weight protein-tyrosine-phosphatase n=1 Tax=Ectothiorhodospira shaposhnikovii TaxID=1054 RepID=UPI001EE961CF|nr:low molecular weight protein-tyrosine-phosphatase [Ectothiorhodospira shaposhnikovii]MCG5514347.1 low molecular weight phosphotyrosine protein phosphatase [Ectothiorhodospira shaposhnikovii]
MFKHLLILCTGNICRSPFAEACLRQQLETAGRDVRVESAGIGALVGHPADEITRRLAADQGLSLEEHRAVQVTEDHVRRADLILVMEPVHRQYLLELSPSARGKVFLLGHWSERVIEDPYRRSESVYQRVHEEIRQGVGEWLSRV